MELENLKLYPDPDVSELSKIAAKYFSDKILDETKQKSDISDFGHIEKVSKIKLDKFYKFLEDRIEKELKNSNFDEDYPEIEMKKVNGKWQLEFDFNTFINENFFNE